MSDKLRDAVEVWANAYGDFLRCITYSSASQAAAAVIEAYAKEREAAKVAEIVAWLREDNGRCDCAAREQCECACGGWDDYKTKPLLDIAAYIEAKWGKQ